MIPLDEKRTKQKPVLERTELKEGFRCALYYLSKRIEDQKALIGRPTRRIKKDRIVSVVNTVTREKKIKRKIVIEGKYMI